MTYIMYLASLAICSYTMLYIFMIDVISYQVKLLKFYNDPTTNWTYVDKKTRYTISSHSIEYFQIVTLNKMSSITFYLV